VRTKTSRGIDPNDGPIALFLGAGASKPFGFPVTDEILPELLRRLAKGDLLPNESAGELQTLLARLLPGLFVAGVAPPLITDVFSLLDQMIGAESALGPGMDAADLGRLRLLLEQGVAEVLAEPRGAARRAGPALQARLAAWIYRTCGPGRRFISVISTNYDFGLERRLLSRFSPRSIPTRVDFGLTWRPAQGALRRRSCPRPPRPSLAIYDLHGALNWLRCPLCEHVFIHPSEPIFREGQSGDSWRTCSCGYAPLRHVLVAPSMVRQVRDPSLMSIWQSALEGLRTAAQWIIGGYSLPPQDVDIRSMLLRAFHARPAPPRVRVVEHGKNREVEDRYRVLFPDLVFDAGGVEGLVRRLRVPRRRA
jgi:hypothetical protein